ncbi:MAG: hypothetical protein GY822_22990 [Deltaproteobacteria bacterium]|nr:hypothetical protein [Deltaproteobacteria bacterium]
MSDSTSPLGNKHRADFDPLAREKTSDTAKGEPALAAVDLGLRSGMAFFDAKGRLLSVRSLSFASHAALKDAVFTLLPSSLRELWCEGDPHLAAIWGKVIQKRHGKLHVVSAEQWRPHLLTLKEQRSGKVAKEAALRRAHALMASEGIPKRSRSDDVAEAVLLGRYALAKLGWRSLEIP